MEYEYEPLPAVLDKIIEDVARRAVELEGARNLMTGLSGLYDMIPALETGFGCDEYDIKARLNEQFQAFYFDFWGEPTPASTLCRCFPQSKTGTPVNNHSRDLAFDIRYPYFLEFDLSLNEQPFVTYMTYTPSMYVTGPTLLDGIVDRSTDDGVPYSKTLAQQFGLL